MRDLVSGRIDVKTPGNRSERYLYSSNTGGRGQILLLCREWYDSRFSPEIYLYDDDIISIDIDEFSSFNIELKSN